MLGSMIMKEERGPGPRQRPRNLSADPQRRARNYGGFSRQIHGRMISAPPGRVKKLVPLLACMRLLENAY